MGEFSFSNPAFCELLIGHKWMIKFYISQNSKFKINLMES